MSIPPIDPSATYTASRVKFTLTSAEFSELGPTEAEFRRRDASLEEGIPRVQGDLTAASKRSDAVEAVFFGIGDYLGGLEKEAEGLEGRVVVPITGADIDQAKEGKGILFTPPPSPPDSNTNPVEFMGPLRKTDLFGGTLPSPGLRPDNELDGINAEIPLLGIPSPTPADDLAWHAALTKEANGLAKQLSGLGVVTSPPWNRTDLGTVIANATAAQADVAAHQPLSLLTMTTAQKAARTAFITNRKNTQILPRITNNATERNREYEFRFQLLDSLVNKAHGVGSFEASLNRLLVFITEQKAFFDNFLKIYRAVIAG